MKINALSIVVLLALFFCAAAQDDPDAPVTGVAVHLTEEQQARFDRTFSIFTDPQEQARSKITRIIAVGIPHSIDETALIERLELARETWKSWKSGNSSIDTSTAFDVLRIPFFPGEPDFTLVYDGYYSSNERTSKLRIKETTGLNKFVIRYKCEPDCKLTDVGPGDSGRLTNMPMPVYRVIWVEEGVLHAFAYEVYKTITQ